MCKYLLQPITGIHYSIGKALSFHDSNDTASESDIDHWFELGACNNCPYSALEIWRRRHKPNVRTIYITLLNYS